MKCKSCEIEKEENDFYKGSRVCKKCRIQLIKEWKKNNPEKVKASVKKRRKECHGEILERERKYREDNSEDRVHATIEGRARKQVWNATKKGILTRPKRCQMCSVECKPEAHHADYNRPLEVIWVCRLCHGGIHIALRKN